MCTTTTEVRFAGETLEKARVLDSKAARLRVTMLGAGRFHVESASQPGHGHVVETAAREMAGWRCSCPWGTKAADGGGRMCSHVRAVAMAEAHELCGEVAA